MRDSEAAPGGRCTLRSLGRALDNGHVLQQDDSVRRSRSQRVDRLGAGHELFHDVSSGIGAGGYAACPVCGHPARLSLVHPEAHIYRCGACDHAYSRINTVVVRRHDHNAPLRAIDLPRTGRFVHGVLMARVAACLGLGMLMRRTYLQTLVCRRPTAVSTDAREP